MYEAEGIERGDGSCDASVWRGRVCASEPRLLGRARCVRESERGAARARGIHATRRAVVGAAQPATRVVRPDQTSCARARMHDPSVVLRCVSHCVCVRESPCGELCRVRVGAAHLLARSDIQILPRQWRPAVPRMRHMPCSARAALPACHASLLGLGQKPRNGHLSTTTQLGPASERASRRRFARLPTLGPLVRPHFGNSSPLGRPQHVGGHGHTPNEEGADEAT